MSAPVQFDRYDAVLARRGSKWVCATVISRAIGPVANPYTVQYESDRKRTDLAAGDVKRNPKRQQLSELGRANPPLAALLAHKDVRIHNDAVLADPTLSRQGVLVGQVVYSPLDADSKPLPEEEHRFGIVVQACAPVDGGTFVAQYAVVWNYSPDEIAVYDTKKDLVQLLQLRTRFHNLPVDTPVTISADADQLIGAFKTQVFGENRDSDEETPKCAPLPRRAHTWQLTRCERGTRDTLAPDSGHSRSCARSAAAIYLSPAHVCSERGARDTLAPDSGHSRSCACRGVCCDCMVQHSTLATYPTDTPVTCRPPHAETMAPMPLPPMPPAPPPPAARNSSSRSGPSR